MNSRGGSLERVMQMLGYLEKPMVAENDLPLGLQAHRLHEGGEKGEQFGYAASPSGRVYVQHPQAL